MRPVPSRLLSGRNQLSVTEREAILEQVLADSRVAGDDRASRSWLRQRRWAAVAAGLAAASAIALVMHVRAGTGTGGPEANEMFAARGAAGHQMEVVCASSGQVGQCPVGDRLILDLAGAAEPVHFAAFARRGDGMIIWYFPEREQDSTVPLAENMRSGVFDRTVILGPEHSPGTYTVHGVFSDQAMTREDVRDAIRDGQDEVGVVVRSLEVLP